MTTVLPSGGNYFAKLPLDAYPAEIEDLSAQTRIDETIEELTPSFEQVRRDIGRLVILLKRDKREHNERLADLLQADQLLATAQHAATYRTDTVVLMTAAKCALEAASVFMLAFPKISLTGAENLSKWAGVDVFDVTRFNGDLSEFGDTASKFFQSFASVTETVKQLYETRHAGDRTEVSSLESRLKTFLDRRHQESIQAGKDEDDAIRDLEQARRQEAEVKSVLCR